MVTLRALAVLSQHLLHISATMRDGRERIGWDWNELRGGDAQRPLWLLGRVLIERRDSVERDEIV